MIRKYENEVELLELVRSFEAAAVARDEWGHAEHLLVALHYVTMHDLATATDRMREGILNLLRSGFNIDLTKEMPYHETLTVFWMRTIAKFNNTKNGASLLDKANALVELFDKDYPLRFYSRELLFSGDARARFVEPDLVPART